MMIEHLDLSHFAILRGFGGAIHHTKVAGPSAVRVLLGFRAAKAAKDSQSRSYLIP